MSRHEYCKTCIDGRECIAYSERSGCDWHNSPEKCKARDDARLKKESAATVAQQPQERHSDDFDGCDDYDMEGDLS